MRPVRLEMRGFGAFRDLVDIDFDDTDFFALVGPTGSGKSTIIDALCFALYGKIPRLGSANAAGTVTSVGATETVVRLTFAIRDDRYVVARMLRLGRTKEVRLEQVRSDGTTITLAAQARETDRLVESIVGLTFEHFTRCVVLPQGEFARFLHDEPKDRRALLVRLLGLGLYDVMRKRADEMSREAGTRRAVLAEQLGAARVLDAHEEIALRARAAQLVTLDTQVVHVLHRASDLERQVVDDERAIDAAQSRCASLEHIVVPPEVDDLARRHDQASTALEARRAEAAVALARCSDLRAARAALADRGWVTNLIAVHERVARGLVVIEEREREVVVAQQTERAADDRERAADSVRIDARAARDRVARGLAAHDLAAHLELGEPCPVCEQLVVQRPDRATPVELGAADRALADAERTVDATRRAQRAAADERAEAVSRLAQAQGQLAMLSGQLEDVPDLARLRATLQQVEQADGVLATAEQALVAGDAEVASAAAHLDQLAAGVRALADQLHRQRDPVAGLDPPKPDADVVASWRTLVAWSAPRLVEQQVLLADLRDHRRAATDLKAGLERDTLVAAAALGVHASQARELPGAVGRAAAELDATLRSAEADRVRVGMLAAEVEQLGERADVAGALALHLRSDRFQDWLVTESLDVLAAAASTLLHRLSGGQFSLRYRENDFAVVDHRNGDEQRDARTLSGGETFQASLALALALADHIAGMGAGGGAALDAIFLDEGFGSLDADSLETVAETIESLGGNGRVVGIVTHVRELAERVPVRYVVTKAARTSTVQRVVG